MVSFPPRNHICQRILAENRGLYIVHGFVFGHSKLLTGRRCVVVLHAVTTKCQDWDPFCYECPFTVTVLYSALAGNYSEVSVQPDTAIIMRHCGGLQTTCIYLVCDLSAPYFM